MRDTTSVPAQNSTFGTVEFRRTITNNTGGSVSRLRFRIADQRTFPAPSTYADMRNRTSSSGLVTVDRAPCGAGTSNVTVNGTTLEQPPNQPNGSAFNSTMSAGAVSLGTPLAPGASIDVRLLFGIQQTGIDSARIIVEALTSGTATPPTLTCLGMTSASGPMTNFCQGPVANPDAFAAVEDTPLVVPAGGVLANDVDPDGAPLLVVLASVTPPAHGDLSIAANGAFTYLPDDDYSGADSFTYKVTNGTRESTATTVTLTVADVVDAPGSATRFVPLAPSRLLDTREPGDITGAAPVGADASIALQVAGRGGVPSTGVSAVVLNVTAADAAAPGFVTAWPNLEVRPQASNLNITSAEQNIANLVTVALGGDGKVALYSQSGTHLVADIAGYYEPVETTSNAGRYTALAPDRLLDTRLAVGVPGTGPVPADGQIDVVIAGAAACPPPASPRSCST